MTRRWAVGITAVSAGCIAVAYGSAFAPGGAAWGVWLMIVGLGLMVVALMVLGAARGDGGVGALAAPLAFTFVVIVGGFAAALLLPAGGAGERVVLGLPLRSAIVLYGVGVLPLVVLPLAYAATFDRLTLRDDDLARVRELAARRAERDAANAEPVVP